MNLVAKAQVAQADREAARKALNAGKGGHGDVQLAQERLDATKLQLVILRDQYEIPGKWSRPRWLFGEGFDREKFWREQVEAISQVMTLAEGAQDARLVAMREGAAAAQSLDQHYNWNNAGNDAARPILRQAIENILAHLPAA